ncbi:MAG: amidohydrolase family protein [Pirellulales bacterium]|nr:amidohydrolase family protein [Pirellulales bacterium]MBL7192404.1 amidohydrolase family protein [Pirellulales bacterium]
MRVDAHQHFWRYDPAEYDWIGEGMERLARNYLPADLAPLLTAEGIAGSVAVQARQTIEETRWLLGLAAKHPAILGVVGWVDLRSSEVGEQLREFAANPRFVGVRHVVQNEPDVRFLLGEAFVGGLRQLHGFGLTYDLLLFPPQLPAAVELAGMMPEQPFVLDHLAKPLIKPGILDPWQADLRALARHPNVSCKLSGLVTEAAWQGWKRADFAPYLEVALEAFGPKRLMLGSDWPVCLLAAEYPDVVGIVTDFIARLSDSEQALILGSTASRFYGLTR